MAINAELGRIGKVGAELDEKRSELFIQAVEIVEVYIGSAVIDPGDGTPVMAESLRTVRGTRAFSWATDNDHALSMSAPIWKSDKLAGLKTG